MEEKNNEEIKKVDKVEKKEIKKKKIILKNTKGEDVPQQDYFFSKEGKETAHENFNSKMQCGMPVNREELIEVFNKIFKPELNFLFYKVQDKELYTVIVPLKHSRLIGEFNDSPEGAFEVHAMSFISEGSTTTENMKAKLTKVASTIKIVD